MNFDVVCSCAVLVVVTLFCGEDPMITSRHVMIQRPGTKRLLLFARIPI